MAIDLVRFQDYLLLIHVNDQIWRAIPAEDRSRSIYDLAAHSIAVEPVDANLADVMDVASDPYHFCVAHYARTFPSFVLCDVGAQYGTTTMDTVRLARRAGGTFRTFAFDAGMAGELTWRNFENNRIDVTFMQAAVGPYDGHAAMFSEAGQSENNRLINAREGSGYAVRCVRLDTVLAAADAIGPTCAKIDVQGAEPAVLAGMERTIDSHPVTMQIEFTPWAMRESGIDPVKFLEGIMRDNHVFDIGSDRKHVLELGPAAEAVTGVDVTFPHWADFLVVPRSLPGIDFVLQRLRSARNYNVR